MSERNRPLRAVAAPFVVAYASGVAIRDRLRVSGADEAVLRQVGVFLGSLASRDLASRCRDGVDHNGWAVRKRELTAVSSSRWAGAITRSTNDQWALARRNLVDYLRNLDAGIGMLRRRLSLPLGAKGDRREPGGYRSAQEWHAKSRRLAALQDRRGKAEADLRAGRMRVSRGGKRLANVRHHLDQVQLT